MKTDLTKINEVLYVEHKRLIELRATEFAKMYERDVDDLMGEGHAAFMKATNTWDGKRPFGRYLWTALNNQFLRYLKLTDVPKVDDSKIEVLDVVNDPSERLHFQDVLDKLSEEAKYVVGLLLDGPGEVLELIGWETARQIRSKLRHHLQDKGLGKKRAFSVLREVREAVHHVAVR